MGRFRCHTAALLFFAAIPATLRAQARFDLAGPRVDVRVTRGSTTLPIAAVPNLQPGDQIWVHPALPASQSVHYLLIVAFLRGTTNPPPDSWFTRVETWKPAVRDEGVTVIVPPEAQQALLFLAPETGGDYSTLRSAVQGRPGVFVRASQDLTEAGFEQGRIDKYLESMKLVPPSDQAALLEHSNLLARTLSLKPNADCFKRALDQQYNCLTQTGAQTLLDDGHGQSMVASLSTGAGSDFINTASTTRLAGGGEYSAYVGAIVDLARILNGIHTAQYQYIPGLALPQDDALALRLNTPPSFHNPKSVIVIGLPAIQKAVAPPLRPADPHHVSCVLNPHLVLPVEGAPLVFTTGFAHDLVLHLQMPLEGHKTTDLPLSADAFQGGLTLAATTSPRRELTLDPVVLPTPPATPVSGTAVSGTAVSGTAPVGPGAILHGTIEGFWGFDRFSGPTLLVQQTPGAGWHLLEQQETHLIAGQPNHVELMATGTSCVETIALEPGNTHLEWKHKTAAPESKLEEARPLEVVLNLQKDATPGSIQLSIQQFGSKTQDRFGTRTFSEPAKLGALRVHAGDRQVVLNGSALEQVKTVTLHDVTFIPDPTASDGKSLTLNLPTADKEPAWKAGEHLTGEVHLGDGRTLPIATIVEPARPSVTLLSRRVVSSAPSAIHLASPNDLPLGATMEFFLKSKTGFPRTEKIEVAQVNAPEGEEPLKTTLSVAGGSLVLEDAHTVLATFDPLKTFGPSTYGAFHLRAVAADGTEGQWVPLATIVRLPVLTGVTCAADTTQSCSLAGSSLYLIDAVSTNAGFNPQNLVPEGFVEPELVIPRPDAAGFYLKLRDDPETAQFAVVPVTVLSAPRVSAAGKLRR